MLEAFQNQYWTRLIAMEDFHPGEQERYELGPDIAAEVEDIRRLDVDEMPEWTPLFDPQRFQEEHPQPLLEDWRLDQADLLDLAKEVVEIRAGINRKAALSPALVPLANGNLDFDSINRGLTEASGIHDAEPVELNLPVDALEGLQAAVPLNDLPGCFLRLSPRRGPLGPQRQHADPSINRDEVECGVDEGKRIRRGLKHSTAAKHPNGLSEKEIRTQKQLEKPVGSKYKKRRRR